MASNETLSGKYRIVRKIAAGGMAEVFLADATNIGGFRKAVAFKRVLPHLSENQEFIEMFLDEARLCAKLHHPNIVDVYDIGVADDRFFLVMEYVDGCDLSRAIRELRNVGLRIPISTALFIAIRACDGLQYAHKKEDRNGTPLRIVHRDVSPANILLSKEGSIKIADFGLAKAQTQLKDTDPGIVKGKFSYLSPEIASGNAIDHRSDIFSLATVLWEMLTGRRLFEGGNDLQTLKQVRRAEVPVLKRVLPQADAALSELLARALTKDPDNRFQTAAAFGRAMEDYLFEKQMRVGRAEVQRLVEQTLAGQEKAHAEDPIQASELAKIIESELERFQSLQEDSSKFGFAVSPEQAETSEDEKTSDQPPYPSRIDKTGVFDAHLSTRAEANTVPLEYGGWIVSLVLLALLLTGFFFYLGA